uniref:Uncharacterized protein n=1 Tax=Hyaloperonospora arabidopsidis (strain Emoy2) TaxID=559515 RepID=M4B2P7_HYAAE
MDPETIRTKGQGDTFKEKAPGRRSQEKGQILWEEELEEPTKERTAARLPVKRYQKKMTTNSHWRIRSPRVPPPGR